MSVKRYDPSDYTALQADLDQNVRWLHAAEQQRDELQKELEARQYDIRYACDRITEHADEARKLRSMNYELQERLDRLLISVDAAARWIRNCSTPLDAACELEIAAAKARG